MGKLRDFRLCTLQTIRVTVKFLSQRHLLSTRTVCQVLVEGQVTNSQVTQGARIPLVQKKIKVDKDFNLLVDYLKELEADLKSKHYNCLFFDWLYEEKNLQSLKADLKEQVLVFYKGSEAKQKVQQGLASRTNK